MSNRRISTGELQELLNDTVDILSLDLFKEKLGENLNDRYR